MTSSTTNQGQQLDYKIIAKGQNGPHKPKHLQLSSDDDLFDFLDGKPGPTKVNWNQGIVIGISLGKQNTEGFDIDINDRLRINYGPMDGAIIISFTAVEPAGFIRSIETYPYIIIQIKDIVWAYNIHFHEIPGKCIVIATTGSFHDFKIVPESSYYPSSYTKIYGPSFKEDCLDFIQSNVEEGFANYI
jgi:hypothetical protein